MSALKNLFETSLVRYGIVGIANTLFGLTVIYCFKFAGSGDVMANLFGYCCGLLLSFKLNSKWTFRYQGRLLSAFYTFCAVIIVSYLLNLSIVMVAIHALGMNSYLAQSMGIVPYTATSYLGCRFFVFPRKLSAAATDP
jgi:putative flippase GtrA